MITIFEWIDFKDVANELSKNSKESYLRSAIDRYYYALFGSSREYLIKERDKYFLKKGGNDIHQRVKNELISSNDYNENEIGEILDKLRELRNQSSYDKNKFNKKHFEKNLEIMKKDLSLAFESLEYLKRNPPIDRWQ